MATTLVLGASGGIGREVVKMLQAKNHSVIAIGRDLEKLKSLHDDLNLSGYLSCDITQPQEVVDLFKSLDTSFAPFSAVVHCVGSITLKPAHLLKNEEWDQSLLLNLTSVFYVLRESLKRWLTAKTPGRFVACSTAAASIGLPNHEAIVSAKAGLEGLIRSSAASYASKGILINGVAPGLIDTPLSAKITRNEAALAASLNMHPLGRVGKPQDIASAIAWLLDEQQTWITGQVLTIDGGLSGIKTR